MIFSRDVETTENKDRTERWQNSLNRGDLVAIDKTI